MSPTVLYTAFDVVPSPKGASTHITYFVRGLVQAGYEVHLLTAGTPGLPAEGTYEGARIWRFQSQDTNFLRRAMAFSRMVAHHLATHPDYAVVHFRSIWSGLPAVRAGDGRRPPYRTVYEVNGLPSIELKYHYPALRNQPLLEKLRQQEVFALHRADRILCPSRVTREYIRSLGIPPERIVVIPNGVDPTRFAPRPVEPTEPPTLLYVGTLASWQGVETALDAMPHILAERPVRLRIVGGGRKARLKMLRRRIRKQGLTDWVSLEGPLPPDQIPELINQATICLAPLGYNDRNVTQGCSPIKLLEYMACRRPVVAANLPVVRELMREGVDALLFTPDDPGDLARAVLRLLDDPALADRLAEAAYQRVRREFTWHTAQERLLEVYREMGAGGRQGAGSVKRET